MNKILILLATSLTIMSATPQTSIEYDRGYVSGAEDGAEMVLSALNSQICIGHYETRGLPPGPECLKFIKVFEDIDRKYDAAKKRVEEIDKNGKDSNRNKKNPG